MILSTEKASSFCSFSRNAAALGTWYQAGNIIWRPHLTFAQRAYPSRLTSTRDFIVFTHVIRIFYSFQKDADPFIFIDIEGESSEETTTFDDLSDELTIPTTIPISDVDLTLSQDESQNCSIGNFTFDPGKRLSVYQQGWPIKRV